jgi:hypothetical protein
MVYAPIVTPNPTRCLFIPLQTSNGVGCSPYSAIGSFNETLNLWTLDQEDDAIQLIFLPFTFNWLGVHPVTYVVVSTNGNINVDKYNNPSTESFFNLRPIVADSTPSRISVMQEDLNPSASGSIYTRHVTSPQEAFIISWEGVAYYGSTAEVNAQAVLYAAPTHLPTHSVVSHAGCVVASVACAKLHFNGC